MAGKISEYPAKSTFDDTDLYDCSTTGTVSEKVTYSQIKDDLKNTFHTQGGNSYGADLTVGTNDTNDVIIETDGVEAVRVDTARNTKLDEGIQIGNATGVAQWQDVYIRKSVLTFRQVLAYDTDTLNGTTIAYSDVLECSVLVEGIDGRFYPPEHTYTANSLYHTYVRDSAGLATIGVIVPSASTNFALTSEIRIVITYLA